MPLPPLEQPGQHVDFTTAPFPGELVSVGVPSAHLLLSHASAKDLVFFGKVYDVDASGTATLIHRLIAPVRVPAAEVGQPVDLKLLGFAHRFAKGHSARLTLAATDATSYNAKVPDVITVRSAGSTFTLPGQAVPGRVRSQPAGGRGSTGSPGCGTCGRRAGDLGRAAAGDRSGRRPSRGSPRPACWRCPGGPSALCVTDITLSGQFPALRARRCTRHTAT